MSEAKNLGGNLYMVVNGKKIYPADSVKIDPKLSCSKCGSNEYIASVTEEERSKLIIITLDSDIKAAADEWTNHGNYFALVRCTNCDTVIMY